MNYEQVPNTEENNAQTSWKPFLRQLLVISGPWTLSFVLGMAFGLPTVMIPQIRKEANSTEAVSEEMAGWLYSVIGYSSLPWIVILCISIGRFGRKIPFAFVGITTFASFILFYFSRSLYMILIAEIMVGVPQACNLSLNIIVVSEYASPKHRGIFITIKSANFYWGICFSNAIGTFYSWTYIPLFGIFLSLFGIVIPVKFWPESPQWLASKGKFIRCKKSHRWLRGTDLQSETELEELVLSQIDNHETNTATSHYALRDAIKAVSCKSFYKPMLLTILLITQITLTGKVVLVIYVLEIIKKMTDSESTAYIGMLILDALTIAASYTGCLLTRVLNRRTLLFFGCFIGIAFLFIISLYSYLIELAVLIEINVITLVLLTLVSIFIGCGPMILLIPLAGEVTPLRYKSSITLIYSFALLFFTSTALKLFPMICLAFRLSGTFLFYAVGSLLCSLALYKYLPETKDKTLQEIENTIIGKQTIAQEREAFTC